MPSLTDDYDKLKRMKNKRWRQVAIILGLVVFSLWCLSMVGSILTTSWGLGITSQGDDTADCDYCDSNVSNDQGTKVGWMISSLRLISLILFLVPLFIVAFLLIVYLLTMSYNLLMKC